MDAIVIAKARAGEAVTLTISTGDVEVTPDLIIMRAFPNEKIVFRLVFVQK